MLRNLKYYKYAIVLPWSKGLEAHRDVVGVINMGTLHSGGMPIKVLALPLASKVEWDEVGA